MYEQDKVDLRYNLAKRIDVDNGDAVQFIMLPSMTRRTTTVTKDRRERLVAHLHTCMAKRTEPTPTPHDKHSDIATLPAAEQRTREERLCGTCRGHCCQHGAEHAYLTVDTLTRYLADHPQHSQQEAIKAYADHVPDRA